MGYEDELIMFNSLSDKQREIVFKKQGRFVVRACPGSGKTYTVAARFANIINNWDRKYQGIAAISFTNIAWQEIEKMATTQFGVKKPIPYPHFLGTIDSFINQFIFLPFGHLVLGCVNRPTLVGNPKGAWSVRNFRQKAFDNMSYDINGDLNLTRIKNVRGGPEKYRNDYEKAQKDLNKRGFASQSDSNYFSMRILENYTQIAKAITNRFPIIIIDEAQDTSDIQMKIIDILLENGLEEIMMVGDPDQAIYEFHDANPALLNDKYESWEENSVILNDNRRSSQSVCDFTFHLSSLPKSSAAIADELKGIALSPQILSYSPDDIESINKLIENFLTECTSNNIHLGQGKVAVLTRGRSFVNKIIGAEYSFPDTNPWDKKDIYIGDIAHAKYLWDNNIDTKKAFYIARNTLIKFKNSRTHFTNNELNEIIFEKGYVKVMKDTHEFLNYIPEPDTVLSKWVVSLNDMMSEKFTDTVFAINEDYGHLLMSDIFSADSAKKKFNDYTLNTIHGVKGETFEAVLVLLKIKGGSGSHYKTLLESDIKSVDNEELRIVYVGITRPRKLLYLAVPEKAEDAFKKRFYPES
ncbi:MAG: ATP-dependent helicase [Candidatus Marinimicrobia bacterium]|nr:ATP-dependent helicase [Candidatus Neomarinimicrobiota bacterium]